MSTFFKIQPYEKDTQNTQKSKNERGKGIFEYFEYEIPPFKNEKIFPDEENCPLAFIGNRGICVDIETSPEKGMVLIPDYVTPDDLATAMKLFAFSHFDAIVIALGGDVSKIRRNVIITPLNLYELEE